MRNSITLCCLLLLTACDLFTEESGRLQATSLPPATTRANETADTRPESDPQPVAPPSAHTITLAVEESDLASYQPLIELFEAQHPDIGVRILSTAEVTNPDDQEPIAALASAADIFPYAPDVSQSQQYLLDLQPLVSLDTAFRPDDFQPGLLDEDGPLWSLPVAASYPLIFFDKAAFDAVGLAYPQPGWTLDEFLTTAQALTIREGDTVTQWGYVPYYVQPLLAAQLTTPVLPEDGTPRLTDPDVAAAVRWVADLFTTHQVSPWLEVSQAEELVDDGGAAMWSGGHVRWQFMDEDDNIGATTMPRSIQGYAIEPTRYAFAISRGTQSADAAWQLLAFLSQQPPVSDFVELLVPARRSVAAAANFWERVPEPLRAPLQYAVDNNSGARSTIALLPALAAVVEEGESAADALAQAQVAAGGQVAEAEAAEPIVVATPPTEGAGAVTEILFATTWWNVSAPHQRLAAVFNQEHPDIKVTVRRINSANDYFQEIADADCFVSRSSVHNSPIAEYARPLDPLLELDPVLTADDFFPGAMTGLTQQGELLGLPAWIGVPLIEYNQALFAAEGLTEPPPDWTLDQFLQIAQALTDPTAEQFGYIDWWNDIVWSDQAQFGVELAGESDGMPTLDFTAAAPMLNWYVDLVARYGVHPVLPGYMKSLDEAFDRSGLFYELAESGKVAMWPYDPTDLALREHLAGNVETSYAPIPLGPSGYSFSIPDSLTAYYIAAETPHAQACWEWFKFLVTQPTASDYLPAHIATAQSAGFAEHVGDKLAEAMLASVAGGSPQVVWTEEAAQDWLTPGYVWLTVAAETAAKGEMDLESALAEAEEMFSRYHECVIEQQAFDDGAAWGACAIQVDPELDSRF